MIWSQDLGSVFGVVSLYVRACCRRYGVLVLVVEVMGASTVVLYGINLLFLPDAPVYHPDPARPGLPKARHFLLGFFNGV